jgi:hypothetical protein
MNDTRIYIHLSRISHYDEGYRSTLNSVYNITALNGWGVAALDCIANSTHDGTRRRRWHSSNSHRRIPYRKNTLHTFFQLKNCSTRATVDVHVWPFLHVIYPYKLKERGSQTVSRCKTFVLFSHVFTLAPRAPMAILQPWYEPRLNEQPRSSLLRFKILYSGARDGFY